MTKEEAIVVENALKVLTRKVFDAGRGSQAEAHLVLRAGTIIREEINRHDSD